MLIGPEDYLLQDREGLPAALKVLLVDYPREAWSSDPGFSDLVRYWIERHLMFRRLLSVMQEEVEDLLEETQEVARVAAHLQRYGTFFLSELNLHHRIEDEKYFPKLRRFDPRLDLGFELLDRDHHAIDAHLEVFAKDLRGGLEAISQGLDPRPQAEVLATRMQRLDHVMNRHLIDEEELIVPVILKYAPDGNV